MHIQYRCPLCSTALQLDGRSLICENGHCFDIAKEGYVNLLTVQNKRSKAPGDSAEMIQARRRFLAKGYYTKFSKTVADIVKETSSLTLLDIGCGEGFYDQTLLSNIPKLTVRGIDISKPAVKLCAKAMKESQYSVASAYSLPYFDESFDSALSIFSPLDEKEAARILKSEGHLIFCGPGKNHLKQLAEHIYDKVKPHEGNPLELEETTLDITDKTKCQYQVTVAQEDIPDLLMMTPYYWSCSEEKKAALFELEQLEVNLDFEILTLKKST